MALWVAGDKEGNGKGGKSDGGGNKEGDGKKMGDGDGNNIGYGNDNEGGRQEIGQWEKTTINQAKAVVMMVVAGQQGGLLPWLWWQ